MTVQTCSKKIRKTIFIFRAAAAKTEEAIRKYAKVAAITVSNK